MGKTWKDSQEFKSTKQRMGKTNKSVNKMLKQIKKQQANKFKRKSDEDLEVEQINE